MKKKQAKCLNCKHFDGKNCHKNGNIGIVIKYREEKKVFLKTPEELNNSGACESYGRT